MDVWVNSSEVEGGHSVKFVRLLGISASLMDNFGLLSCTCCQPLESSKSTSLLVCVWEYYEFVHASIKDRGGKISVNHCTHLSQHGRDRDSEGRMESESDTETFNWGEPIP